MKLVRLLAVFVCLYSVMAHAILEVTVLKQDEEAFPIVIAPFEVVGNVKQGQEIANIMRDNFNRSGEFNASSSKDVINTEVDYGKCVLKKQKHWYTEELKKLTKKSLK